jgi:hypothetical protein
MPLDVERGIARAPGCGGETEALATRVDGDGKIAFLGRLEDRQVAGLAVRPLRAADEQDVDEALVGRHPPDLGGRCERILRRAEDRAAHARIAEPALPHPFLVRPGELESPVGARHQGHEDRVVGVEHTDPDAQRVQELPTHVVEARARRPPRPVLEVLPEERVRVHPGIAGQAERLALDAKPVALGRIDVREDVLDVGDLDVHVEVDHEPDRTPG